MANGSDSMAERTYEPTQLRLAEARRRGQVPRSADLAAAVVLLGGAAALGLLGARLLSESVDMTARLLDGRADPLASPGALADAAWAAVSPVVAAVAPLAAMLLLLAVVGNVVQIGLLAAAEPVRPDGSRISLASGVRRLLSARTLARGGFGVAKLAAIGLVAALSVAEALPQVAAMGRLAPADLAAEAGGMALGLAVRIALVLLALGVAEYLYQRRQHRRDLRMTRSEWLDDLRRMEAPELTRRRRGERPSPEEPARSREIDRV